MCLSLLAGCFASAQSTSEIFCGAHTIFPGCHRALARHMRVLLDVVRAVCVLLLEVSDAVTLRYRGNRPALFHVRQLNIHVFQS